MKAHDVTEEQIRALTPIIRQIASKFRFGYLDIEDMTQQGFLELFGAIEDGSYDDTMSLETFAKNHVHHRLFNYKRNNFCRKEYPCLCCELETPDIEKCKKFIKWEKRNNLKMGLTQGSSEGIEFQVGFGATPEEEVVSSELLQNIDDKLPVDLRKDYLRMKDGAVVSKKKREIIKEAVRGIIDGQN